MKQLARFIVWYGGGDEVLLDAHVYGGGILVAIGLGAYWWPAGLIAFGALLVFIGLRNRHA
jgi:hypothetical protein